MVKKIAENFGTKVTIPNNFFSMVAERHVSVKKELEQEGLMKLERKISSLPATKALYYEEPYRKRFSSKVLAVLDKKYLVLEETCFYPEGGGQPADFGTITFGKKSAKILNVQKIGRSILHEFSGPCPKVGGVVEGILDWRRRFSLMRHHTSTHILIGAIRRVLGEHAWQAGAEKGVEKSRLDISHYESFNDEEINKIEKLAFETIKRDIPVKTVWLPREEAERQYGFRIYQGGAVPGAEIRIVKVGEWDVEACGGIHLNTTSEVGMLKILRTERIQDGVERIIFASGSQVLDYMQERDRILSKISFLLKVPVEDIEKKIEFYLEENKKARKNLEKLRTQLAKYELRELLSKSLDINGLKLIVEKRTLEDERDLIMLGEEIVNKSPSTVVVFILARKFSRILVHAGKKAIELGVDAGEIANGLAKLVGGKGGGKKFFGQGGGTKIIEAEKAMSLARKLLSRQMKR